MKQKEKISFFDTEEKKQMILNTPKAKSNQNAINQNKGEEFKEAVKDNNPKTAKYKKMLELSSDMHGKNFYKDNYNGILNYKI